MLRSPRHKDAAATWLFTHISYDTFSRMVMAQKPDNNAVHVDYEGCGCAGNMTKRVTDECRARGHACPQRRESVNGVGVKITR